MAVFVANTLIMPGCASQTAQPVALEQREKAPAHFRLPLPPGAKVGLATARYPTIALVDTRHDVIGSDVNDHSQRPSYTRKILEAIPKFTWDCLTDAKTLITLLFPLCLVMVPAMGVSLALTAGAGADIANAVRQEFRENTSDEKEKTAEELALEPAISESRASLRPFLERVQRYVYDSGIGELTELPNQTPQSDADKPGYHGGPDYVFEVAVTGPKLIYINRGWFKFHAQGQLVRTNDNSVVDTYKAGAYTSSNTLDAWREDNAKLLVTELDSALDELAKQFVDEWIKPLLQGYVEAPIRKDIEVTPEPTKGVVKRTDEEDKSLLKRPDEEDSWGVVKRAVEEKPIRKDVERKPTPSDSPFPDSTNPMHEWYRSRYSR